MYQPHDLMPKMNSVLFWDADDNYSWREISKFIFFCIATLIHKPRLGTTKVVMSILLICIEFNSLDTNNYVSFDVVVIEKEAIIFFITIVTFSLLFIFNLVVAHWTLLYLQSLGWTSLWITWHVSKAFLNTLSYL